MHSSAVRAKRFSARPAGIAGLFGERFVAGEVDSFLEECAAALHAHESGAGQAPLRADDIVRKQFARTRYGDGYDPDEVDDFLDELTLVLRRHEAAQRLPEIDHAGPAAPPV
jgi:DivIVA domain-containing protein